jgi:hypothetical protein
MKLLSVSPALHHQSYHFRWTRSGKGAKEKNGVINWNKKTVVDAVGVCHDTCVKFKVPTVVEM